MRFHGVAALFLLPKGTHIFYFLFFIKKIWSGGGGGGGGGGGTEIGSNRRQKLGLYDEQYFGQSRYNPTTYRYYEPECHAKQSKTSLLS